MSSVSSLHTLPSSISCKSEIKGLYGAQRRRRYAARDSFSVQEHIIRACNNKAVEIGGIGIKPISQFVYGRRREWTGKFSAYAVPKGSAKSNEPEETIPSWADPESNEPPPWARDEGKQSASEQSFDIPFYVYLLGSAITAIAAIGSAFEYLNKNPVFGLLESDSIFYAPLLGFFFFTGIPTSGFLWFKSVQAANKEAEEQDKRDGFL